MFKPGRLQPQRRLALFCGTQGPSKFILLSLYISRSSMETGVGHFTIVCSMTWGPFLESLGNLTGPKSYF